MKLSFIPKLSKIACWLSNVELTTSPQHHYLKIRQRLYEMLIMVMIYGYPFIMLNNNIFWNIILTL